MTPELVEGRFRARKLTHKFNTHFPDSATAASLTAERTAILHQLLGHIHSDVFIEPPFNVDYGCNTYLGASFYANFNLTILDCGLVRIGHRVLFGPNVGIFAATHETDVTSRREGVEYARGVEVGDDCWVGGNVVIMAGVRVGKGCTIGAGSVVTKDVPDFSVAVGNPARVVKTVEAVPDLEPEKGEGTAVQTIPEV